MSETATPQGFGVTDQTRTPTPLDIHVLSQQLGRPVRDVAEIPARCTTLRSRTSHGRGQLFSRKPLTT